VLRAVLFDFWNTLFKVRLSDEEYWRYRAECVAGALASAGVQRAPEDVLAALREARRSANAVRRCAGREVAAEVELALALRLLGVDASCELLSALLAAYARPFLEALEPDPDARAVLEELRGRGLRLAVVSNTPFGWANRALLERYSLLGYFDALAFSDEVGFVKPRPEIFEAALAKLGVPASEAAMVGDEADDAVGALRAGVRLVVLVGGARVEGAVTVERLGDVPRVLAAQLY